MLRVMPPEEAMEKRRELIDEIQLALLELQEGSNYPANFHLYQALLMIMNLWEYGEGREYE